MTVSALLNALNLRQIERYVARPLVVFFTFAVLLFGGGSSRRATFSVGAWCLRAGAECFVST